MKTPLLFCLALFFATSFSHAGQQTGSGYRISGVVMDALTSAPVPHAELSISLDGEEFATISGDDGHFLFAGVEPGKYPISAKAPGYVPESYNEHGAFSTAIVVGSGLDSEHLIFRLHREAVITGKVTDERGEPLRDAQVMLFKAEKAASSHSVSARGQAQTNDIGEFRFAHLSAGKYFLAVDAHPWYAQVAFNYAHPAQNDPEKVATFVPRLPAN